MNTLYTVISANGQRASIALEECRIPYESHIVELMKGEHRGEEMMALNPFGRMPVLKKSDGTVVYGSMPIAMRAAEESGRLLPGDNERDAFHHWIGAITTDLTPSFAATFYLGVLAPEKHEWGLEFYTDVIQRYLCVIDEHLSDHEYFLDGGYSLVDVLFYPTAATSIPRTPQGLEPYPNIARWAELVGAREAVQRGIAASS